MDEPRSEWETLSHDQKMALLRSTVETEVLPFLARDGGGVDVVDLVNGTEVTILYRGACATCHMALYGTLGFIQQVLTTKVHPSLIVVPTF
jgi:NifU-like protein